MKQQRHDTETGAGLLATLIFVAVVILIGVVVWSRQGNVPIGQSLIARLESFVPANSSATVTGILTIGPTSPVCRPGAPCTTVAVNRMLDIKNATGASVASVKTNASGEFTIRIQPGTYSVQLVPSVGGQASKQITVHQGNNQMDLDFDTGIR